LINKNRIEHETTLINNCFTIEGKKQEMPIVYYQYPNQSNTTTPPEYCVQIPLIDAVHGTAPLCNWK
jgi:hypothetical protein